MSIIPLIGFFCLYLYNNRNNVFQQVSDPFTLSVSKNILPDTSNTTPFFKNHHDNTSLFLSFPSSSCVKPCNNDDLPEAEVPTIANHGNAYLYLTPKVFFKY